MPDSPSINTARVVVNQSNITSTGGASGSESSSVVDSDAARVVVRRSPAGLELVSLDVKPGWVESARSQTAQELLLRYVSGTSAVDIKVWSNGAGISSSVSSSADR